MSRSTGVKWDRRCARFATMPNEIETELNTHVLLGYFRIFGLKCMKPISRGLP